MSTTNLATTDFTRFDELAVTLNGRSTMGSDMSNAELKEFVEVI